MGAQNGGLRIDKSEMEKLREQNGQKQEEKKPISVKQVITTIIEILIIVGYFGFLVVGRFLPVKDTEFFQSFDIITKTEDPIHLVRLLSYALLTISLCIILRYILLVLSNNKTITKKTGVAVIQLFRNLVKYITIIVLLCLALNALGVDTAGIIAGLGIITLIIGLGVTSLIEDIVAGVFIIAERLFDVGDIVVIDGFRGTVVSIGIRSTKIADVGNDVLTVRNSSIGSLVNLSDRQSAAAITVPIAPEESLERVEQVVKDSHVVEKIKAANPKVLGEPLYLGLYSITNKGVQLVMFVAGCKEDDKHEIERVVFREVKLAFESYGVKLGSQNMYDEEEDN